MNSKALGGLMILVALALTVFFVFASGERGLSVPTGGKDGRVIECTIDVAKDLTGGRLWNEECFDRRESCTIINPFSIFSSDYNLQMLAGERVVDSKNVDLSLLERKETINLEGCVDGKFSAVTIRMYKGKESLFGDELGELETWRSVPIK